MCFFSSTTFSASPRYFHDSTSLVCQVGLQRELSIFDHALRFQANSEVSALLGRIPSAVGYQPTLATDLGGLQERITTNKKGSITSVQVSKFL